MRNKSRYARLLTAVAVPALSAGTVSAATLTPASLLGGYNNAGLFGTYGFISGTYAAGNPNRGNFGVEFAGPTLVSSLTITQYADDGRQKPNQLIIHTSPTQTYTVNLANTQGTQTVDLTAGNGGNPIPRDLHGDARQQRVPRRCRHRPQLRDHVVQLRR